MADHQYIGIDVGTGSVRAALVAKDGCVLKTETLAISIHTPKKDFYEQDSQEIWKAVCHCVKV